MALASGTSDDAVQSVSRNRFLSRLGAVIVGAAAASILVDQEKAVAAAPLCCGGYNACSEDGCLCQSCCGTSCCCWWCSTSSCHAYECIDVPCRFSVKGKCICVRLVCSGCC